mmetsp:Transcript_118179/g.205272  ORF Transcript_118179/g.205272 Transcript_118179/m.205272 type:complete len:361 (+) Transcript_118179:36-1118(+)
MSYSTGSFVFGPTVLAVLVLLLCASWLTTVAGKKSRRKRKAAKKEEPRDYDDMLYLEKHMGPSEYWEEIEADNFQKKVFRKDKDVVLLFYGDQVPRCLMARPGFEQLGELVKNTNPNVRTMRFDDLRFGKDLSSRYKDIAEDFRKDKTLPRMFLIRAYEKKPIQFPLKDLVRPEAMARFLVEHSSFRKEFGFDDYVSNKPQEDKAEEDLVPVGSVGPSKHYKELEPADFRKQVTKRKQDVMLVHYSDQSANCKKFWKLFEKAADFAKSKTKEIKFARLDVRRHNTMEVDRKGKMYLDPEFVELSHQLSLPYAIFLPKNVSKQPELLVSDKLNWYGMDAIMEFLLNHTSDKAAFGMKSEEL